MPDDAEDWEETLNTGDIYAYLDDAIGTQSQGGRRVKYIGDEEMEFAIDRLDVTIRNAPLARPIRKMHRGLKQMRWYVWKFRFGLEANCSLSMVITLKVQAGYIEVF